MKVLNSYGSYKYNMYTNIDADDDSRWATDDEMKNSLSEVIVHERQYESGGIPLISNGKIAYVDNTDTHSLVFGATGSRKTRLLCMPTLNILANAGESFIATDPKGELYERTSGLLTENGYKVVVLNIRNPSYGDAWNPLALPYKYYMDGEKDKASELLNDFVNCITSKSVPDPYWDNTASQFCFGLLLILFECANKEEVNVRSLTYLRTFLNATDNESVLAGMYEKMNKQTLAAISLSGIISVVERNRGTVLSVFDQMIRVFSAQQNLSEMLANSSFDIYNIGLEKTAVFLIMPDEKNTYHFLVSLFIKQCYESLISAAHAQPGYKLPIRTNFVLDEFANIPAIPDMPSMITAARSRNIRFYLVVQSEHQLRNQYKENAQTIKGNCDNWVFLTSRELPLLQEISDLCGNKNKIVSENIGKNVPLISVSQLQHLSKEHGEALVLHGRQYPYITRLADIDQYAFEQYSSIPLIKRDKKPVPIFDLKKYLKDHTEKEIKGLFGDEVFCSEDDSEDESEDEIEKKFEGLFDDI